MLKISSLFEAYITNLGKYNEGRLVGETLKFPATTEEVQSLLKNIGVDGVRYEEFFITAFDGDVMGLYDYLTEYENLDELNHLAHLISELDSDEIETLEAALNKGDHTSSVAEMINLVHNLDCYDLHPGVTDDAVPDMGTVSGGTYTNRFAGISCTLDDSWYFYTDEQIDELNGFVRESTSDEELKTRLESSSSVQDMYAASTDGLMTNNVVFTNMGLLGGSTVTPQDVAELSVEQVPAALESYGFTDVTAQLTTVDFAGQKNVPAVAVSAMNGDIATYELLVCLKAGNYSFSVTLCSFTEDVTADIADLFTAVQ